MSATVQEPAPPAAIPPPSAPLTKRQRRQLVWITLGAVGLFVLVRQLPTGTNLARTDLPSTGASLFQLCDCTNPQFLPVTAVQSPVTMTMATDVPPAVGRPMHVTLHLRTTSGKPVGPNDLLVTHTKLLHLMVVDPSLRDYQHVHPVPGPTPGEWDLDLTPHRAGLYRLFADFTPAATASALYATASFTVPGTPDVPPAADNLMCREDGFGYVLTPQEPFRAGDVVDLTLTVESAGAHRPVRLDPVMGAFAHLVAFDQSRTGFAHIHPLETDLNQRLDPYRPQLTFKVLIPHAGRYVIWSEINSGGRLRFAPFWFEVTP